MRTILAAAVLIGGTWAAWADEAPAVAVPNRPDMPIVVYGCDAAYAVIESEWGLAKNVRIQPVVYGCRAPHPRAVGHYYPTVGRVPGYGRLEVEPPANRALPPRAESYRRSWSAQSAPPLVQPQVPMNPPEIILAPQLGGSIDRPRM